MENSASKEPLNLEEDLIKKPRISRKRRKELVFICIMLAYPVAQFLLTWIFVNFNSIILAFQKVSLEGEVSFAGFDNFVLVVRRIFEKNLGAATIIGGHTISNSLLVVLNSLGYGIITIFISLPLALICSYFLSKKMPFANVFRFIFFLPNIISIVALIYAYRMQVNTEAGLIYQLLAKMKIEVNDTIWPHTSFIVFVYCIWAGLGYNVLLLSGAIGRIPSELFESARMDGAGSFKEFTKIMIPMIWPTVVTLLVLGMTSILTLYLQPVLFELNNTETIAGSIFNGVNSSGAKVQYPYYSAFGLLFSFILAPLILVFRKLLSKKYSDIDC